MFIPEIIDEKCGEFTLISNHNITTYEQLILSIKYNKARINHARLHLPNYINSCKLIYDLRGQNIIDGFISKIKQEFKNLAILEIKL